MTLTPKAAERLGILIDEVRADPSGRLIVPYASVLYDLTGKTWVYISADPLTFVSRRCGDRHHQGRQRVPELKGHPPARRCLRPEVPQVFGTEVKVGH